MSEKDGGAAIVNEPYTGVSLRDYFAAQALSKLTGNCPDDANMNDWPFVDHVAALAYRFADAMLKARQS